MCRGRRARILLHLHVQLEGTVLRGSRAGVCVFVCLLLQDLVQSCLRGEGGIWDVFIGVRVYYCRT
jgi:hypothetical protein